MSIAEVAGEYASTPSTVNPNYKIPKKTKQHGLQADRLNQFAANVSPPAKEKVEEYKNPDQPHKNTKGRQ